MATTLISGKAYEGSSTWPYYTKAYNVTAFQRPETGMQSAGQTIAQRQGMGIRSGLKASQRGLPQLTWFEGTYDVPVKRGSAVCKYPNVVLYGEDGRKCLEPGKMTAAESEAWKKQFELDAEAVSQQTKTSSPCVEVTLNGVKYQARKEGGCGGLCWVDCKTGARLATAVSIKGLGASEYEESQLSKVKSSYRVTELLLGAAVVAGLFVILK